jgi:hypothetical protein
VVGVASAKLAPSFGARPALIRTDGKARSMGRPPEQREVEHRRAKRFLAAVLGYCLSLECLALARKSFPKSD